MVRSGGPIDQLVQLSVAGLVVAVPAHRSPRFSSTVRHVHGVRASPGGPGLWRAALTSNRWIPVVRRVSQAETPTGTRATLGTTDPRSELSVWRYEPIRLSSR
jgi:hypothetical protein